MFRKVPVESVLVYSGHIENAVKLDLSGKKNKQSRIEKVSEYFDFEFNEKGVLARKASGLGSGLQINLKPLKQPATYVCSIHVPTENTMIPVDEYINAKYCLPVKLTPRLMKFQNETELDEPVGRDGDEPQPIDLDEAMEDMSRHEPEEVLEDRSKHEPSAEDDIRMEGSLFTCKTPGCVCVFKSIDRYRQHKEGRMCKIRLRGRAQKGELKYRYAIK